MTGEMPPATGRICYYARQQCALASGCPTIGRIEMGVYVEEVAGRALECGHAGQQLFAWEVATGRLRTDGEAARKRPRLRDQRMLQVGDAALRRVQRQRNDAAAAAREEKHVAEEDE